MPQMFPLNWFIMMNFIIMMLFTFFSSFYFHFSDKMTTNMNVMNLKKNMPWLW